MKLTLSFTKSWSYPIKIKRFLQSARLVVSTNEEVPGSSPDSDLDVHSASNPTLN